MDNDEFFRSIILRWPLTELHLFSYKKLAAEFYKQRSPSAGLAYVLPIIFLHMHLESLIFQNFATIHFACRAGISTAYNYSRAELRDFVRKSRQGDLIDRIELLSRTLVLDSLKGVDTSLINNEERDYVKRLSDTRNYLVHCCHVLEPLLRLGGSTYPLQEANLSEDIEDAFRIVLVLELRLIDTIRHIEATLFECICEADLTVSRQDKSLSFYAYIFKSRENRFRTVVSRTEFPILRISQVAHRWQGFFNFDDLYWPIGNYETSMDDALNNLMKYVQEKWKRDGEVGPLVKRDIHWSPPHISNKDWPWTKYTLSNRTITQQLAKLLKE